MGLQVLPWELNTKGERDGPLRSRGWGGRRGGQEGLGQSDSQEASGHQGLCKSTRMSVLPLSRRSWLARYGALPPLPTSPCL